jgi:hypothetical protein
MAKQDKTDQGDGGPLGLLPGGRKLSALRAAAPMPTSWCDSS